MLNFLTIDGLSIFVPEQVVRVLGWFTQSVTKTTPTPTASDTCAFTGLVFDTVVSNIINDGWQSDSSSFVYQDVTVGLGTPLGR
jgi:hypothetical protein